MGINNLNGAMYYIVAELTYSVCLLEKIYKSQLLQTLFGILTVLPNEFPLLVREYNDGQLLVIIYHLYVEVAGRMRIKIMFALLLLVNFQFQASTQFYPIILQNQRLMFHFLPWMDC